MDELYAIIDQVGIVGLFHSKYLPSVSEIVKVKADRPSWVGWGWVNKLQYEKKRVIQATFLATGNISIVSTRNLPYYYVSLKKAIELDELDKRILSFLRDNGATSRRDLRRAMGVRGKIIGKSIKKLDLSLLIVRAGVQRPESGWVSRIWDLWENFVPKEVLSKCSGMNVEVARKFVIEKYLLMRGP